MKKQRKKKTIKVKVRDENIMLAIKGEINMTTRTSKDKTTYTRKEKHKNKE